MTGVATASLALLFSSGVATASLWGLQQLCDEERVDLGRLSLSESGEVLLSDVEQLRVSGGGCLL